MLYCASNDFNLITSVKMQFPNKVHLGSGRSVGLELQCIEEYIVEIIKFAVVIVYKIGFG